MQIIPLETWYPAMAAKWSGRTVARSEREAWVVHHTAGGAGTSPLSYARGVADMHYDRWGVPGGYQALVGTDGVVREMCGLDRQGVHSGTHYWNRHGLGLAFQGDFRTNPPSELMLAAGAEYMGQIVLPQTYHRAVRPTFTHCPGDSLIALLPLELEDDMPAPKDWTRDDWNAFKDNAGWGMFPGKPADQGGRSAWQTLNDIKTMVGALDSEGVSEAELDQRVTQLLSLLPDRVLARLRERLG